MLFFCRNLKTEHIDDCTILNILLDTPEERDLKHIKPSARMEDKIFALDQKQMTTEHTFPKGNTCTKHYYQYSIASGSCTVHLENGVIIAKRKASKGYKKDMFCRRKFVNLSAITTRT